MCASCVAQGASVPPYATAGSMSVSAQNSARAERRHDKHRHGAAMPSVRACAASISARIPPETDASQPLLVTSAHVAERGYDQEHKQLTSRAHVRSCTVHRVQDGDMISIDTEQRTMDVDLPSDVLAARRAQWQAPPEKTSGALHKYIRLVSSASRAASPTSEAALWPGWLFSGVGVPGPCRSPAALCVSGLARSRPAVSCWRQLGNHACIDRS